LILGRNNQAAWHPDAGADCAMRCVSYCKPVMLDLVATLLLLLLLSAVLQVWRVQVDWNE
jgi:hypothetical protein